MNCKRVGWFMYYRGGGSYAVQGEEVRMNMH